MKDLQELINAGVKFLNDYPNASRFELCNYLFACNTSLKFADLASITLVIGVIFSKFDANKHW